MLPESSRLSLTLLTDQTLRSNGVESTNPEADISSQLNLQTLAADCDGFGGQLKEGFGTLTESVSHLDLSE